MKRILFVSNWDWVTYNFRYDLAKALKELGHQVIIVCPSGKYIDQFKEDDFEWIEWKLDRRSLNIFKEIKSFRSLFKILRDENPDIVHHDTIKPNLYGSLSIRLLNKFSKKLQNVTCVNSFMGIGYVFSEKTVAKLLRMIVIPLFRYAFNNESVTVTFSNKSDRERFIEYKIVEPKQTEVLISEFVDIEKFPKGKLLNGNKKDNSFKVILAARLLWDKGVQEFVDAAKRLKKQSDDEFEFLLAGEPDEGAPNFVPIPQLKEWDESGIVNWLGYREDIPELLAESDVAVLPTFYNEGMPRFLVEAATVGLPIITTDIEACRLVVKDGENGYLINKKDSKQLAEKLLFLQENKDIQRSMAARSREKAVKEFDKSKNIKNWLKLYNL